MAEEIVRLGYEDADRFDRARRIEWLDVDSIAQKRVLMVGAGAIGNETAKNLVLSGFRHITVVDMDRIVSSNLARCIFFSEADSRAKRLKAEAVAEGISEMDSEVKVTWHPEKVQDLGEDFISGFDLVLGCLDNVLARLYLNSQCCYWKIPYVDAAMDGFRGKVQVVIPPKTPCLECAANRTHSRVVEQRFSCTGNDISLFLPKVGAEITTTSIVSGMQVREALKLASTKADMCIRNVCYYDGARNTMDVLEIDVSPECPNHAWRQGKGGKSL